MTDAPTEPQPQPLSEFLINYPELDRAAGRELAELAAAVQAIDRKGSMTLKLEVAKKNTRVLVQAGTEVKPPKSDPDAGLFFPGPTGLSKDDPTQVRIDWETGALITPDTKEQ